ncbi:type III-A CRISPR-associated RAMP protein Csm3 [Methanospirillum stamsii]|uniref:CRISPR system Cms endoribonuclease Csm3 n=1 Tax=Methanospirillum stamsii TaxID=1277351 RepID=A0A2V2MQE8_9EURY|nr:type III-A CRISPR-associated RAMP protein Csm3 [Methanospirillum stamsii]PWR70464.1 type III-A CRISPR-associated RAMP protein Csm3 [Methanospirillum stamsii]
MELIKNYLIRGKIVCETGLHIGGLSEALKIGGTDSPVIMNRMTNKPYIPGSSIKGKMRSLLELKHGNLWLHPDGKVHSCKDLNCNLCVSFGRSATDDVKSGPTRLIVRDSHPTLETIEKWDNNDDVLHGTEVKGENVLNRLTSSANPRFIERVPAGSAFGFEMVFSIYDPADEDRLKLVFEAMTLLEDNYLGGYGSRGSGKITFSDIELLEKISDDYKTGKDWHPYEKVSGADSVHEILERL